MNILVVSQYFWPENFRINDLCTELVRRGHKVTVLTGVPNYPDGRVFGEYSDEPNSFMEYNGVDICRVPMFPRGVDGGGLGLLLNYISYSVSATTVGLLKLRSRNFDIVFVNQLSPFTVAIPGLVLKLFFRVPMVMWVLDLWPDTLQAVGKVNAKLPLKILQFFVSCFYNKCAFVLAQSKTIREKIQKNCKESIPVYYFPSWSESLFCNADPEPIKELSNSNGYFRILFAGNIGAAQDFPAILNAAAILKNNNVKVHFFIVGDGRLASWVRSEIIERGLGDTVFLLGRHPLEKMPSFYDAADALIVALKSSGAFSMTIPGKVQSYMAAGKPILAMLDGEGARAILESGAGFVCPSGNYEEFAENIAKMSLCDNSELQLFGGNARSYLDKEFNRDMLISKFERLICDLN